MKVSSLNTVIPLLVLALMTSTVFAQNDKEAGRPHINVAVADCPPFVIASNGHYSGLAIYLWERVASHLDVSWEYQEHSLAELLGHIAKPDPDHSNDLVISCISVTAERERLIDFTHSFTETYTAVAVQEPTLGATLRRFIASPKLWTIVLAAILVAALIGGVFFLLEHRNNKKLFSTDTLWGKCIEAMIIGLMFISNGPLRFYRFKTLTARVLSTFLALTGTILIASTTAIMASSFTINSLQSTVRGLDDLRSLRVGALEASTSSAFLNTNGVGHQTLTNLDALIEELSVGEFDAVVSDAAFLSYRINEGKSRGLFGDLAVLPLRLEPQNYAFVLTQGSLLRESINQALLTVRKEREWQEHEKKFFGR